MRCDIVFSEIITNKYKIKLILFLIGHLRSLLHCDEVTRKLFVYSLECDSIFTRKMISVTDTRRF